MSKKILALGSQSASAAGSTYSKQEKGEAHIHAILPIVTGEVVAQYGFPPEISDHSARKNKLP